MTVDRYTNKDTLGAVRELLEVLANCKRKDE